MELNQYLASGEMSGVEFAKAIGISPAYLYHIANGRRAFPVQLVKKAVEFSGGALTERSLRPDDWHKIWPELKEVA